MFDLGRSLRFRHVLLGLALVLLAGGSALAQNNTCETGESPDVIVGDLYDTNNYGAVGGIRGYSVATESCNIGTCWLEWFSGSSNLHPVIGQNMFRLKDGRFEQLGQSWLKHGFFALSDNLCFNDCVSTDGSHLGVHCSDPYSASLNGNQTRLGPRFEVNVHTGFHPHPPTDLNATGNAIFKRLQVRETDLDPALNPGALYFVEGQYVTQDDAAGDNNENNASYRRVNPTGSSYNLSFVGSTIREQSAILAWEANDSGVTTKFVSVPGDGQFIVAAKATDIGGGQWHYEYAIQNNTSHRSAQAVSVPVSGASVTNIGFHDVDYHSGEPFSGTDWGVSLTGGNLSWATQTFAQNENANALRWGTLYNFRFDANAPPVSGNLTITLFRPGSPTTVNTAVLVPDTPTCDNNGTCDPGEDCTTCPADCPGSGSNCCGDATCGPLENPCDCEVDCGVPPTLELICNDGEDQDCDGLTDCNDLDCCGGACGDGPDLDNDSLGICSDCNDADPNVWARPGEVPTLSANMDQGSAVLNWVNIADPGATTMSFDVLRSRNPTTFMFGTNCLLSDDVARSASDAPTPAAGSFFGYQVRAVNGCPTGEGPLGYDSQGTERQGLVCP